MSRTDLSSFGSYICSIITPKSISHGLGRGDFINRFTQTYGDWINEMPISQVEDEGRMETDSVVPDHGIFGFDNEIKSLKIFLLDKKVYKEFRSLVIVGEYGVGKTTLCKMIYNEKEVKNVYAPRIWVSMKSRETEKGEDNKISVLKRILKGLGFEDSMLYRIHREVVEHTAAKEKTGEIDGETVKELELSALLYAVNLNLKWKKYLIVFDDVREEDNWSEMLGLDEEQLEGTKWGTHLSDGFPKGSGGRLIYTTRDETLAKKLVAEDREIHRLWPLSDSKYVWNIYEEAFRKNGRIYADPPRNDKKCLDELMNKSRGLPLAIRLLAELDPVYLDDELSPTDDSIQERAEPAIPVEDYGRDPSLL